MTSSWPDRSPVRVRCLLRRVAALCAAGLCVLLAAPPVAAQPAGWAHKATLRVEPATPMADYQVKLTLNRATFDYSKAKPDGSDLRVYAGATELPYWIETWDSAGTSTLWVKVAAANTASLHLYFGNAAATAVSDGAATFELFDDFTSLAAWTLRTQATGTAVQATVDGRSVAQLTSPDLSNGSVLTRPFASSGTAGYVIETRAQRPTPGSDGILVAFTDNSLNASYSDLPDNGYIGYLFRHGNSRSGLIRMVNAGAAGSGEWSIVDSGVADQWYVGGLRWSGDTLTSERDRQTVVSAPGQAFSALTHLHISTLASVWNFDWVLVRKGAVVDSIATVVTPLVYTASHLASSVTVHTNPASGDVAPLKTYGGANTGIATPACAFVAGDELFVTNHHANSITVHDINAAGDAPPKRSISGNLSNPAHCWVDNGELYVANANGGSVQVYNSSDYGNAVVPKRVLDVPARGLAVYGDELILPQDYNVTAGNTIYIYPKTASNPATPSRTITGSNTLLAGLVGVHASNGELFAMTSGAVRVFNIGDNGNVAPKRSISGAQTGFAFPVAVWTIGDELFIADANGNRISVFNRNDSGDIAPKRVITGAATGLNYPYHVTADARLVPLAMYEAEGNALDSSGAHHGTTSGGVTYTAGVAGQAFRLNGSTGKVTVPAFDMGNNWTIEGWIRPDTCSDNSHCPMLVRSAGNQDGLFLGYGGPGHSAAGQFLFDIGGSGAWQLVMTSGGKYASTAWHHLVATRNGDTYTLFVNGEQRAQQVVPGASTAYQSRDLQMGYWYYSVGESYVNGAIDQVSIFDTALAASEVRNRYVRLASACPNLLAGAISWWTGDGGTHDTVGNNPAVAVGGITYTPGKSGQAFNLDGSSGYVRVAQPNALPTGSAPRTMALWVKTPANFYSTTEWAMMQYGTAAGSQMFGLITSGNAPYRLYFYGNSNDVAGATTLQPDTWYHVAVTYDGYLLRLYLNGQIDAEAVVGALNTTLSADGLTLGLRPPDGPGATRWKGEIDEAAVFNRALSTAEVALLYAGTGSACLPQNSTSTSINAHTPNPSVVGQPITVQATVTATTPATGTLGGSIVVSDGNTTCSIVLPATSCTVTPASAGTITLNARYSGDGVFFASQATPVAHTVVAADQQSTLTVTRPGSAGGNVSSANSEINCGSTCSHLYANGSAVTLTAAPDADAIFTGWLGHCAGTGPCQITVNSDTTVSATFAPSALAPFPIDVDLNHTYEAAFDGVLMLRRLFGFGGLALTVNATGTNAGRTDPAQIASYVTDLLPLLDIDGNGRVDALTDGLLLLRYLTGLRGDALVNGALGSGATRTLAADIEAAIAARMP
ncbi:MAG TPA: DUF2341 domain-containing protein [Casimicrobium huifangae]|nr:DUF2341 domain-containing protein [Casimicrobium huifangae]